MDVVRARQVTPVIPIYCVVAAEPYCAGSLRTQILYICVSYGFPEPELVLLRKHTPETAETQ